MATRYVASTPEPTMSYRTRAAALLAAALAAFLSVFAVPPLGLADHASLTAHTQDANLTRLTTRVLEQSQFSHHPFDAKLANTLLDRYLDTLDPARSLFLQSDVHEFDAYRATLAQATREAGDTSAAHAIFKRYIQRLQQQVAYMSEALQTAAFDFTGHDVYQIDRSEAQRPRDLAQAQALWKELLRSEYLHEKLAGKAPAEISKLLARRHMQQLKTLQALRSDEVLEMYLDTLAHVYDPHSDYLGHEQLESFSISMNLSLFGIGASLQSKDGYCEVRELLPGGPAAKSGLLHPGDRIIGVAQGEKPSVDIVNMPLSRAVELIRGPKGTIVKLTILPAEAPEASTSRIAAIVRDEIKLEDQAAKARIVDVPKPSGPNLRLGVIELPSFYESSARKGEKGRSATRDVAALIRKLKAEHVRGIVLDLRRNGGGSLSEAIDMTGLFIRTGPVVQTRDQSGHVEAGVDRDPAIAYDGPLVVLTSRFSASASEILAGALQDYGRALIVGDPSTFGKGTVQTMLPLGRIMESAGVRYASDPGALKITTNKFYRPSGASTQLRGVASDIVLPSLSDLSDLTESSLKNPLAWDVVKAKEYEHLDRVQPYLAALRASSTERVAKSEQFSYITTEIARIKQKLEAKSVSLNEPERRAELAENKARRDEQARTLVSVREASPMVEYEITLANAAAPGLPAASTPSKPAHATQKGSAADDPEGASALQDAADTTVVRETLQILSDYVDLLNASARTSGTVNNNSVRPASVRPTAPGTLGS